MKIRKPPQTKDGRKTSDATLASCYRDLRKLRDEVRKAECATTTEQNPGLENNLLVSASELTRGND